MIGYHYTSFENWQAIKKTKILEPHKYKEPLWGYYPEIIFLWPNRQNILSHIGIILDRVAQKRTTRVVMLMVRYRLEDIWLPNSFARVKKLTPEGFPELVNTDVVKYTHNGDLGGYVYHELQPFIPLKNKI